MRVVSKHGFSGFTPDMPEPCLLVTLADADLAPSADWLQALHAQLPEPGVAAVLSDPPATQAHALGMALVGLFQHIGLATFADAVVQTSPQRTSLLRLPAGNGLQPAIGRLVEVLVRALPPEAPTAGGGSGRQAVDEAVAVLASLAPAGKNRRIILQAASRLGIPWTPLGPQIFRLGQGHRSRWFDSSVTDRTPGLAIGFARDKHRTASLLRRQGIPVPRQQLVASEEEAVAAAQQLGFPVVVKPGDQDRGVGVRARLRHDAAVRAAYRSARQHSAMVLVEQQVPGEDHRFHVFADQVYRVRHRVPGGVTGDGVASVSELLDRLNEATRARDVEQGERRVEMALDDEALDLLQEQALHPAAVPGAGQFVRLRSIANVSVGGTSYPVPLEQVHPDNLLLAQRAVRALRLDIAAVDMLIPDVRRSWMEVGAGICEVNAKPQFGDGAPEHILGALFPDQGRIPVVMVLGDAEPGWWHQVRERAWRSRVRVGVHAPDGLWSGPHCIAPVPAEGAYRAADLLLGESDVQALLLRPDEQWLRLGLPVDRIDALVLAAPVESPAALELLRWLLPRSKAVRYASQPATRQAATLAPRLVQALQARGARFEAPELLLPWIAQVLTARSSSTPTEVLP